MPIKEWPACSYCGSTDPLRGRDGCPVCEARQHHRWSFEDYRDEILLLGALVALAWIVTAWAHDFEDARRSFGWAVFGALAFRVGAAWKAEQMTSECRAQLASAREAADRQRDRLLSRLERTVPNWDDLPWAERIQKWREWTGDPKFL